MEVRERERERSRGNWFIELPSSRLTLVVHSRYEIPFTWATIDYRFRVNRSIDHSIAFNGARGYRSARSASFAKIVAFQLSTTYDTTRNSANEQLNRATNEKIVVKGYPLCLWFVSFKEWSDRNIFASREV